MFNTSFKLSLFLAIFATSSFLSSFCLADTSSKILYENAKEAMKSQCYHEAIEIYTGLIEEYPDYVDLFYDRAEAYDKIHEYDKALKDLDIFIKANPWSIKGYEKRGFVYLSKEDYERALKDYSRAIEISPENVTDRILRMRVNFELGNYQSVIADCDEVKDPGESEDDILKWRGYVSFAKGNYEDAIKHLTDAINLRELLTESSEYYFNIAEYSLYADKEDEAIYFKRGAAFFKTGNLKAGISDFQKGVNVLLHSRVFYEGQESVALRSLSEAISAFPDNMDLRNLRILIFETYCRIQEAENDVEALLKKNPEDESAIFLLAKIYFSKGDFALAYQFLDQVESQYKESEEYYAYRGLSAAHLGKTDASIHDILKAAALSKNPDDIFLPLVTAARIEGNLQLIERATNEWVRVVPLSTDARFAKWLILENNGDKNADDYINNLIALMSDTNAKAVRAVLFSKYLVDNDKPEKAMAFLDMAEKINSQEVTTSISMVKSMAHLELKEYEKSRNYSQRVIERFSLRNKDKYKRPNQAEQEAYDNMKGALFMTNACSLAMLDELDKTKEVLQRMINDNIRTSESALFDECRKTLNKNADLRSLSTKVFSNIEYGKNI